MHDYIRQRVAERVGQDRAAVGGFHIYTTVDMHLQMQAERSLLELVPRFSRNDPDRSAFGRFAE